MILMPQIFDVTANENARYKPNELEFKFACIDFPTFETADPFTLKSRP